MRYLQAEKNWIVLRENQKTLRVFTTKFWWSFCHEVFPETNSGEEGLAYSSCIASKYNTLW